MTRAEVIAFNAGVRITLDHARRIAQVIEARGRRPLAEGFAVEALRALADEGVALLLAVPTEPSGDRP